MMTLDWNLGWTNQSEIGGGSFYNQSVSQPANVYTPLFNINQGVPAFASVAQLSDGSIPTSASSPSARPTITVVPANYHNPYTLNWNVSIQHAIKKNYMVEVVVRRHAQHRLQRQLQLELAALGDGHRRERQRHRPDAAGQLGLPQHLGQQFVGRQRHPGLQALSQPGRRQLSVQLRQHDLPFGNHQAGKTVLVWPELPHVRDLAEGYPERPGQPLPERPI